MTGTPNKQTEIDPAGRTASELLLAYAELEEAHYRWEHNYLWKTREGVAEFQAVFLRHGFIEASGMSYSWFTRKMREAALTAVASETRSRS